jgi:hypothetical protein
MNFFIQYKGTENRENAFLSYIINANTLSANSLKCKKNNNIKERNGEEQPTLIAITTIGIIFHSSDEL